MPKSEDKYVEKCSTAQSFIRTEMSTYRIGTLIKLFEKRLGFIFTQTWNATTEFTISEKPSRQIDIECYVTQKNQNHFATYIVDK